MKLTIFTPVYNRKDLLEVLYDSLEKQTNKNFIWLIVDDGSTDGVSELIENMARKSSFPIQYIYQKNQGKHVAHNTGVSSCNTKLFFCVDSDDTLLPEAVDIILTFDEQNKYKKLLGYYFRKIDTEGHISGEKFVINKDEVGLREIYHEYNFVGELAIVFKTSMIKKHEFPVFPNEKFVSELVLYNELNDVAPMAWNNEVIYRYEYQENGYSNNAVKLLAKNPYGSACGFLSEAQYASSMLQRAKSYSSFLALKKVFSVNGDNMPFFQVNTIDKIIANCFVWHYYKLFKKIKNKYL